MIKIVALLKRRPGLSVEEFRDYYERNHARIGEKYLPHRARYVRRYLTALPHGGAGPAPEPEFDVITETWFPDQASADADFARIRTPDALAEIQEDEAKLFDTSRMLFFLVDERESLQDS